MTQQLLTKTTPHIRVILITLNSPVRLAEILSKKLKPEF
jgi:hypothetical protein